MRALFSSSMRFLSSEVRGLQMTVYILAFSALLSSLLALFRDRLFAHTFGAGLELDLYYAAFRIPDLIFVAAGALVSVYVLIPELSKRSEAEQRNYIDTIIVGFSFLIIAAASIAYVFAPDILARLFPQYASIGHGSTLVELTRIMLIQPILLGFSNICAAITQTKRRYLLYSLSPLLYNAGIIVGLFAFYPTMGLPGLATGVVVGAALHLGIQIPSAFADGFFSRLPWIRDVRALITTIAISIPRALSLSVAQIAFLGLVALAAFLEEGSVAVFIFAFNLQAVPLSVIGASYSVAAFPTLAAALSRGEREVFMANITTAARYVLFWSLPTTALIIVLRAHLVRVILGSGAFDWTDTRLTAAAFAIFALGLAAQGLTLLLVRGYYAAGRTFTPFFVAVAMAFGIIGSARYFLHLFESPATLAFVQQLFRLEDVEGSSVLALALAYALVSILGTVVLAFLFERRFGGFVREIVPSLVHGVFAGLAAASAAYTVLSILGPLTLASTLLSVFVRGFAAGIVGIAAAALIYALFSNREFFETVAGLQNRLWKSAPPVQPISSAEEASASGPQ